MSAIYDWLSIPFGWVLSFFYNISGNYLLSLFLLTLIVRAILLPSTIKQQKSSAAQLRLQAKVKKIREKYAGNQQKINEETQALYQKEGFNPMSSGCLPLLIQFPIIIGLFGVIYKPLSEVLNIENSVIEKLTAALTTIENSGFAATSAKGAGNRPEIYILKNFDALLDKVPEAAPYADRVKEFADGYKFFGIDLSATPSFKNFDILWVIPALVLVTSFLTSIFMLIKQKQQQGGDKQQLLSSGCMMLMSPLMSVYFSFILPTGVGIYWCMSNVISFIQTLILNYTHSPKKLVARLMIDETVERRSKEENIKKIKAMQDNTDD